MIDPATYRRQARRIAYRYRNGRITRAVCIARLRQAAIATGLTPPGRPTRVDKILDALIHGRGDIEPGLYPRHLQTLIDSHTAGNLDDTTLADGIADLHKRLRRDEPPQPR